MPLSQLEVTVKKKHCKKFRETAKLQKVKRDIARDHCTAETIDIQP